MRRYAEQSINKLHVVTGVETEAKIYKSVLMKSHVNWIDVITAL